MSNGSSSNSKILLYSTSLSQHIEDLRREFEQDYQAIKSGELTESSFVERQISKILSLEELIDKDTLTSLLNQRAFHERLLKILITSRRVERSESEAIGCLVACDINNLKQFNHRYGHAKFNQLIQVHAKVFKRGIRANDLAARIGLNQFMLYLDGIFPEQALQIAQDRIKPEIAQEITQALGNLEVVTNLSIGIIPIWKEMADQTTEDNIEDLTEGAADALYVAKVNPDRIAFSIGDGNYQIIGE